MSEFSNHMDDVFKSAYQQFKEEPSVQVWEKLNAALNEKAAKAKKSGRWKRVSLLLMMLFIAFKLFESNPLQINSTPKAASPSTTNAYDKDHQSLHAATPSPTIKANTEKSAPFTNWLGSTELLMEKDSKVTAIAQYEQDIEHFSLMGIAPERTELNGIVLKSELENSLQLHEKYFQPINNLIANNQGRRRFNPFKTITAFVSCDFAQYRIDSDLPAANSMKQGKEREPSYSFGALFTGELSRKWMLQFGLVYSKTNIAIAPQKIFAVPDPNGGNSFKYITPSGYALIRPGFGSFPVVGDSLITAEAEHMLYHLSIPVVIKYRMGKGRFAFVPGGGIAANFLTGTRVETEISDASNKEIVNVTRLNGARTFNWSVVADAEIQYRVNKKLSINLRPAFKYAITSITDNDEIETFPYSFGIGGGVTLKF